MVSCQAVEERDNARGTGKAFVATLVVAGDPYWRSTTTSNVQEAITSSGETFVATNDGDLDSYPLIRIIPQDQRLITAVTYRYRRFSIVRWQSALGSVNYPVLVSGDSSWDTTPLTPTKVVNETGCGCVVDGVEVSRWFGGATGAAGGFDSTTTKMWINLDFQPALTVTLAVAIASSGLVTEVVANEDISAFPGTGLLLIGSELFTYTGRDDYRRAFTGCARAPYGTAPAAHSAGSVVEWIQHEVWVVYGPHTAMAMTPDDGQRPLIDLASSTNGSWVWGNLGSNGFGSALQPERSAAWLPIATGSGSTFTASLTPGGTAEPYDVIGIDNEPLTIADSTVRWQVYLPCGIFDYDATGADNVAGTPALIAVSTNGINWVTSDVTNGSVSGWTAWNETGTSLNTQWRYLGFLSNGATLSQLSAITITIHNVLRPIVTLASEENNYELEMTITNQTTGEAITVAVLPGLTLGTGHIEVDAGARTVIDPEYGVSRYSAMRRSTLRRDILRLAPGANTIKVEEYQIAWVDVLLEWEERFYS
jgi:hypothetical protein